MRARLLQIRRDFSLDDQEVESVVNYEMFLNVLAGLKHSFEHVQQQEGNAEAAAAPKAAPAKGAAAPRRVTSAKPASGGDPGSRKLAKGTVGAKKGR